ncbi:hypothetical protein BN946_scf184996.g27 [Trametes cinnabarina]|uniref:SNF5-domain-containing protein n=1 Tax=Pycnoporus cinnabarinus TaxID=5643 RepID=A0A060S326_PYCCI|nr:hypothetical protein BN946_scf184996.g27 [Trametes cinnabarina]
MSQGGGSINPAFLAGSAAGSNPNISSTPQPPPQPGLSPQQIQQMHAMRSSMSSASGGQVGGGMGINPAMFQQGGGTMNPAALMNGMGGMGSMNGGGMGGGMANMGGMGGGMNGMSGMSRMAHYQQMQAQAHAQAQRMSMNVGSGGGAMGGGMGMNPAQLTQQQQMGGGGINPAALGGGMNMNTMGGMGGMQGMGNLGGMSMQGMQGMNMGMGMGMGGSSITSPTSGPSSLPNMSQSSPTLPTPSTPNLGMQSQGPNTVHMSQLGQMTPQQMKALQMQRAAMAAGMHGGGGGMGMGGIGGMSMGNMANISIANMGMGGGGMGNLTPAQMQQMQMLQQQQQQQQQQSQQHHSQQQHQSQPHLQQQQAHTPRPPSSASYNAHAHRFSQGQLQHQQHQTSPASTPGAGPHAPQPQVGMMPPPSSIPPRPPTASSHHAHGQPQAHGIHGYGQQHGGQQGFVVPSPSPRPGTAQGHRPGTGTQPSTPSASQQIQGQQQSQQNKPPTPIQQSPRAPAAPLPTYNAHSPAVSEGQGQGQKGPSRPTTAMGQQTQTPRVHAAQLGQQGVQQSQQGGQQQQQHGQQQQAKASPTYQQSGFTPIAPAPSTQQQQALNSPQIGAKRKASGTPAPVPPAKAPTPGPTAANAAPSSSSTGTPAPLQMTRTTSSTGIAGMGISGNVPGQSPVQAPLMTGVGMGMGMNMGGIPSGAVTGGGPIGMTSPTAATALPGMGMGGMGVDGMMPQTPLRQPSLPPSAVSPFQSLTSPISGGPGIPVSISGKTSANGKPAAASETPAPAPVPTTKIIPQLPPLPTTVKLDPKVTRVSVVPLVDSDKAIPPLSTEEIKSVQTWMRADQEYEARYRTMKERMAEEVRETVAKPRAWWEKDFALDGAEEGRRRRQEKFVLTGLKQAKEKEMREKKRAGKREGLRLPRRIPDEDAKKPEQLVPIRLEFDVEHHKMRDTFVWNLSDPIITPEIFAQSIVDDYSLAPSYHAIITKSIQEQLSDYKAHSATFGEDGTSLMLTDADDADDEDEVVMRGRINDEEAAWWAAWRKRVRSKALYKLTAPPPEVRSRKRRKVVKEETPAASVAPRPEGDVPMAVDDFEEDEKLMHEEMRILIKLDIVVGSIKLEDQFEWDLENRDPTPEQFAEVYCKDLGLGGEFKTAIAHSIREQVQIYQKSLFLVGHPSDGSAVQDDDLRMSLLPSLVSGARSMEQVEAFTPVLQYLSESEIEKNEKDREKELARRKRKTTRGRRGVALPDREPPKTFRTPAIGFPEVSPAALALAAAAAAPTSRRAAAAAASLTIANMVASENGTTILPQSASAPLTPLAPTPSTKEKKPKGLFKPPSYPSSVLRPRANISMPTPSTAADVANLPPPIEDDLPAPSSSGDRQGSKVVLTAKRGKEREREAKEREYADGQHANMIDGVWHCSNCGCPESIAIGRRKGPLGDKSQCGTCGKYWHRHRRPRPVVYNSSAEYHLGLIRAEEQAKSGSKRKRPQSTVAEEPVRSQAAEDGENETPGPLKPKSVSKQESAVPEERSDAVPDGLDRAASPMSTASSADGSPLAQRVKMNGSGHSKSAPPSHESDQISKSESTSTMAQAASPPQATPSRSAPSAPPAQNPPPPAPQWLMDCLAAMQAKYPDDIFEAVIRRNANSGMGEFRIKCADCPGKVRRYSTIRTLNTYAYRR